MTRWLPVRLARTAPVSRARRRAGRSAGRRSHVRRRLRRPRKLPGPFRPGFFRSPLRGPWLTSVLGSILLVLIAIVALTGFLSHAAYLPNLPGNAIVPADRDLPFLGWPPARRGCTRSRKGCT